MIVVVALLRAPSHVRGVVDSCCGAGKTCDAVEHGREYRPKALPKRVRRAAPRDVVCV